MLINEMLELSFSGSFESTCISITGTDITVHSGGHSDLKTSHK